MMKKNILFLLLIVNFLLAGQLTAIEYFFNDDPGQGNGIAVSLTPGDEIDEEFSVDLTELSEGFHQLYIRVADEDGAWSMVEANPFILFNPVIQQQDLFIMEMEYFFDVDPGVGFGEPLDASGLSMVSEEFYLDMSQVPAGFHNLFVRVKDGNGHWSMSFARPFFIYAPVPAIETVPAVAVEYFIDADPGFGDGIAVDLGPGIDVDTTMPLDLSGVGNGFHIIHLRTMDANGKWSHTHSAPFFMEEVSPAMNIVSLDYVFSDDTGPVLAQSNSAFLPSTDIDLDMIIELDDLEFGHPYTLQIRALDEQGLSSLTTTHFFEIDPEDCAGVVGGEALLDDCGICSGGTTDHVANSDMDCNQDCYGTAFIDNCGECAGGDTGLVENWAMDCHGTCFGESVIDCTGLCGGSALIDVCGVCAGGETGLPVNTCDGQMDSGICNGDFQGPDFDGCGVCFGEDQADICGQCNGNGWDMCDDDGNGVPNVEQYGHGAYDIMVTDIPADQGGWVMVNFHRSIYDTDPLADRVDETYYVQVFEEAWVTLTSAPAIAEDIYSVMVHTLQDSVSTDNGIRAYRVLAGMNEGDFEPVELGFGYSVDNIEPAVPTNLLAARIDATVELDWDPPVDADFQYFSIYRNGLLLDYSVSGSYLDAWPTFGEIEYTVTATDIHENESDFSNIANAIVGIPGDVDFSHVVDVQDIILLISFIFGATPTAYEMWAGDVDQTQIHDVVDVILIVDIILSGRIAPGQPLSEALVLVQENQLTIRTVGGMAGIQLDVSGDYHLNPYDVKLDGWEMFSDDGMILLINLAGSHLGSDEELIIRYNGNIRVNDGLAVDWYLGRVNPEIEVLPVEYGIVTIYPNPFNPEATIEYMLKESRHVNISVYDMLGRHVITLVDDLQEAGYRSVRWLADDAASGTYMIRMETSDFQDTKMVQLVK